MFIYFYPLIVIFGNFLLAVFELYTIVSSKLWYNNFDKTTTAVRFLEIIYVFFP